MATLSFSQLESYWEQAGGSKTLAPVMAAIALAESGGNPAALNPSDNGGTQSSFGLWQISNGTHSPPASNWSDPLENAKLAVGKYKSQGLGAWGTYDSGAYKQYLNGNAPATSSQAAAPGGGGVTSAAQTADLTAFSTSAASALDSTTSLLHGSALVLDRVFALFAPGQGWRIVFGAGAVAAGAGAVVTFRAGGDEDAGPLPLSIALAGLAALAAFFALRPWPQTTAGAIKPGAYVVDVLEGRPPPAGPDAVSGTEVDLTEAGLAALVGLWATAKVAQGASAAVNAAGGAAGLFGGIWKWLKGLGAEAGDVGEAA